MNKLMNWDVEFKKTITKIFVLIMIGCGALVSGYITYSLIACIDKALQPTDRQLERERLERGAANGTLHPEQITSLARIREDSTGFMMFLVPAVALSAIGGGVAVRKMFPTPLIEKLENEGMTPPPIPINDS